MEKEKTVSFRTFNDVFMWLKRESEDSRVPVSQIINEILLKRMRDGK